MERILLFHKGKNGKPRRYIATFEAVEHAQDYIRQLIAEEATRKVEDYEIITAKEQVKHG